MSETTVDSLDEEMLKTKYEPEELEALGGFEELNYRRHFDTLE